MIIAMDALVRKFDQHTVLNGLTAQIERGDVVALLGKNGAGKSTLLHTILGFGLPDGGAITLWQTPSSAITQQQKQKIGFVPQQDELLEQLTGAEHIKLFSKFRPDWDQACCDR
ncbi:MAG: ATP-binding cassette domain-containing protein, partial [Rheinheimera sp.]